MKHAVVFGSGHVARPAIRTLLDAGLRVTVATNVPDAARAMIDGHPEGRVVEVDATDRASVRRAVAQGDGAISLLPVFLHGRIAEACLVERKHFVSTSYTSEEIRALDGLARRRGLVFLNELGADPGIDHMQATRAVHHIQADGGRVKALRSVCGGLPAPDSSDNPFRYKLSWSPRGVVLAGGRPARYLDGGELKNVERYHIFDSPAQVKIPEVGDFESLPNGDSLRYLDSYSLGDPETLFRGTLRWAGWAETWAVLCSLGFVDDASNARLVGPSYAAEMRAATGAREGEATDEALARAAGVTPWHPIVKRMEWLGLLSDEMLPANAQTRMDLLVSRMEATMAYASDQRDMLALVHEIDFKDAAGRPHHYRARFVVYGDPNGDTAMARCVGIPAACGLRRILDGTISEPGVRIPVSPDIFGPVLADIEALGLTEIHETVPAG